MADVREGGAARRGPRAPALRRRRDRRGRGLRGALVPPELPLSRSRAEQFDDLVLDAVEHLEQRFAGELENVEFAVEDVPPPELTGLDQDDPVPLARLVPAAGSGRDATPPRIVVYRRPLEARAFDRDDLGDLVLDVIVHEVARLLGVEPEVVDPEGHGYDDEEE